MSRENYNNMTSAEKAGEDFMSKNWRPMMAMTYMLTCLFDFIIGPILYNILQFYNPGQHLDMWQPLTLQGGGLYHIAMGVVLGITAHGRTQEKINGADGSLVSSFTNVISRQHNSQPVAPIQAAQNFPAATHGFTQEPTVSANKFGNVVPQPEEPIL